MLEGYSLLAFYDFDVGVGFVVGPNGFERSCTLEGSAGQHEPDVIRAIVGKMVPKV